MRLYYTRSGEALDGYERRNPRFFGEPEADVEAVLVDGDWPQIAEAYSAIGVPVEVRIEAGGASPPVGQMFVPPPRAVPLEQRHTVYIPAGWMELPWSSKVGLTLRQVASLLSDAPVLNRNQAFLAIETELARRDHLAAGAAQATRATQVAAEPAEAAPAPNPGPDADA